MEQYRYMRLLKEKAPGVIPDVFPIDDGYVMPMLNSYAESGNWLPQWPRNMMIAHLLPIWVHDPVPVSRDWRELLYETLEIIAPPWSYENERPHLTHGDPTLCNSLADRSVVKLIDAIWPARVPQISSVDLARIFQSMLGWEIMIGHYDFVEWEMPPFIYSPRTEQHLRQIIFWTGVMMRRVEQGVRRKGLDVEGDWANHLGKELFRAVGV